MAHWIIEGHGFGGTYYKCSNCRHSWNDIYEDVSSEDVCPACGELIFKDEAEYIDKQKNKRKAAKYAKALDDYVSNYGKDDDCDIDVAIAKHNYEVYQNDLKQRSSDLVKKWNRKIAEASSKGEKFFMTNQFVTDDDKDKIIFMLNECNCCVDFPLDATLKHFQQYYESKGFKVVRIEYPTNNICCLKIIWVSSSDT